MKRVLSKSNVSRHENEKLPRNSTAYEIHAFARTFHYDLEATLISSIVHVRRRQRVNRGLIMSAADVTDLKASYRNYRPVIDLSLIHI